MKKIGWFHRILTVVVVLVLVLALLAGTIPLWVDPVVRNMVEKNALSLLGVPVSVEKVSLNPYTGRMRLKGVAVGNPENYSQNNMFSLEEMCIHVSMRSLVGGQDSPIIFHSVAITNATVLYETGVFKASNFDALLATTGAQGEARESDRTKVSSPSRTPKEPRKVIIRDFTFVGGKVRCRLGGVTATLSIADIHKTNLGDKGGLTALEITKIIFSSIGGSIANAVKSVGTGIGDLFKSSDK